MGIDSQNLSFEKIDLLRELERARAGLVDKKDKETLNVSTDDQSSLPSEEMKLLEWHEDISEEEGFQVVSHRKSRKKRRSIISRPKKKVGRCDPPPPEGENIPDKGIHKISSGYNLREKRIPNYKLNP